MPRQTKVDKGYLVAKPSGFPGVEIPLLSNEECYARGIKPGRFSPRETWTQAQRGAADQLVEILLPHVLQEAMQVILAELERQPADSKIPEVEIEQVAARRGIALIDAGKWKQRDTSIHFPPSWVREILESFASGDLSLLNSSPPKRRRKKK